jgi:hypothetical protein
MHMAMAQGLDQRQHIIDQSQHIACTPVPVEVVITALGAAIAALVWGNHMETSVSKCG